MAYPEYNNKSHTYKNTHQLLSVYVPGTILITLLIYPILATILLVTFSILQMRKLKHGETN